jgi:NTP pyrophosphatase (non-canonical NTP hydrolase)
MILGDIKTERERQDEKWGGRPGRERIDTNYTEILGEEYGEVCKAVLEHGWLSAELRKELIQVAAVAVAWVEQIDYLNG